jgi:replication fork protection complex subunit Tof1/Swi1
MSSSVLADPLLNDAAEILQQQLIYNGEVLDIAFESLRTYKEGTQSLAYLEKSVYLAYALLKMLERWGKEGAGGDGVYVRRKRGKRRKRKGCSLVPFVVVRLILLYAKAWTMGKGYRMSKMKSQRKTKSYTKRCSLLRLLKWPVVSIGFANVFTYRQHQKFAHSEITRTLLTYLARYKEFSSPESMKRVVSLLHRQAVRAKAEGLFFNVR